MNVRRLNAHRFGRAQRCNLDSLYFMAKHRQTHQAGVSLLNSYLLYCITLGMTVVRTRALMAWPCCLAFCQPIRSYLFAYVDFAHGSDADRGRALTACTSLGRYLPTSTICV
jgi:hypothetical protein